MSVDHVDLTLVTPAPPKRSQICVARSVGPSTGNSMQLVMAEFVESSTQSSRDENSLMEYPVTWDVYPVTWDVPIPLDRKSFRIPILKPYVPSHKWGYSICS